MKLLLALVGLAAQIAAQTVFLDSPVLLWSAFVSPVGEGNECALAPTTSLLLCSSADGGVTALPATSASSATSVEVAWSYSPTQVTASKGTGGITFTTSGTSFVYGSTDSDSSGPTCTVHHLSVLDKQIIWVSPALEGACSGTPVVSFNEKYVFVTHNSNSTGTFTILSGSDGSVFFQESDKVQSLSPPGIFFSPLGGNYESGVGNTNDLLIFGNRPSPDSVEVPEVNSVYAFQFPIGFADSVSGLALIKLLNKTDFQSIKPPLITNSGFSMFWGVSRSKLVGWSNTAFDRDPGGNSVGFDRGDPRSLPILADLAIGSDSQTPTIYTGNAGPNFSAITSEADLVTLWTFNTTTPVYARAKVAPSDADEVVIFIEQAGTVYAVEAASGDLLWNISTGNPVQGNFALNAAGDTIFFADTRGIVNAWQIAEFADNPPTFAPFSASPVDSNSSAPISSNATLAPVVAPTSSNATLAPTVAPTSSNTTLSPVAAPTASNATRSPSPAVSGGNTTYDVILTNATSMGSVVLKLNLTSPSSVSTVFAPYDSAFLSAFNESYISYLLDDPSWMHHLECLGFAHVVSDFTKTSDSWSDGQKLTDLRNTTVTLGVNPPSVNGIIIDSVDNVADNGVVHFIPEVIVPECFEDTIASYLSSNKNFSTLLGLVENSGLLNALETNLPLMLFGPTNEAFEKLDPDVFEYLSNNENIADLRIFLFNHLVRNITYFDLEDGSGSGEILTSNSEAVETVFEGGKWMINTATVVIPNILVKNGIIHGIDEALIPSNIENLPTPKPVTKAPTTRKPTIQETESPVTAAPVTPEPTKGKPSPKPSAKPSSATSKGLSVLLGAVVMLSMWMY